jgi:enoyl-CoA hydratase
MLRTINRTICELYSLPKPVVAAVSGHALGGALVLVLACDIRLAARGDFRLGLTETAAGIPYPAGPLTVVRAELAPESVRILALASATAEPDSPLLRGVIDRVVEPSALLDEAVAEAKRLAAMSAFGRVKQQLRAPVCERLRRIVERDEEPLHEQWV